MSEQEQLPNPYNNRDHESQKQYSKQDVLAVAGLLGQVGGALGAIDRQNVGGDNTNIKAKKIDPRSVLRTLAGNEITQNNIPVQQNINPAIQPVVPAPINTNQLPPVVSTPTPPPVQHVMNGSVDHDDLLRRIEMLERLVDTYKKIIKFKRGVSYSVTTSKIAGEFKDPTTILDLISTEMSKQTKTITLKLNDKTKDR